MKLCLSGRLGSTMLCVFSGGSSIPCSFYLCQWNRTEKNLLFLLEGTTAIIQFNCLSNSGLTKNSRMLFRALSKCPLNIDRLGALVTSLGSLFQCLSTHSAKKCFLMPNLNLSWHIFGPFPCVLSLDTRKGSVLPSLLPLLRNL